MIFKIISFGFLALTLGQLQPCENPEGLFQCEIDCNEIYADCLASCEETSCMSDCSRTHSGCMNDCPCHGDCANGCPCNNKYWKGSFFDNEKLVFNLMLDKLKTLKAQHGK